MNRIDTIICNMTKALLTKSEFSYPEDMDWEALVPELHAQSMDSVLYEFSKLPGVPEKTQAEWQESATQKVFLWLQMMEVQKQFVEALDEAKIPFVILKGTAVGRYYPRPDYRPMGDIDALARPSRMTDALRALEKAGFRIVEKEGHHVVIDKKSILLELHYKFGSGIGGEEEDCLSNLLYEEIEQREMVTGNGYSFPTLPRLGNALVLLQHMANHMKIGVGLRHLLDWVMFVNGEQDADFYEKELRPEAEKLHLWELCKITTKMGVLHLGLSPKTYAWCMDAKDEAANELLEYGLFRGNLGRKNWHTEKKAFSEGKGPLSFLKTLQRRGKVQWKALEKHPWLTPFAWAYQLCHYVRLALGRKHAIKATIEDYKAGQKRREFFESLGLDEEHLPEED